MRRLKRQKSRIDRSGLVDVYEQEKLIGRGRLSWIYHKVYRGGIECGTEPIERPRLEMLGEAPDLTGRELQLYDAQRNVWYFVRLDEPAPYTKKHLINSISEERQR